MIATDPALVALLVSAALHAGFQLTVTALAYPALARVAPARWPAAHQAHSRAIAPVVALLYLALVATCGWSLVAAGPDLWMVLTVAAAGSALLLTALWAGPLHSRLGRCHDPQVLQRLLLVDRCRTVAALACLAAALAAVLT